MVKQNKPIRRWNSISVYIAITNRTTGQNYCLWLNLHTTMLLVPPLVSLHSLPTKDTTLTF